MCICGHTHTHTYKTFKKPVKRNEQRSARVTLVSLAQEGDIRMPVESKVVHFPGIVCAEDNRKCTAD